MNNVCARRSVLVGNGWALGFQAAIVAIFTTAGTLTLGCASTSPHAAPAQRPQAMLTDDQRAMQLEAFDRVWTTIRDKHPDPNVNGVDMEAARAELRPKVETATTPAEAREPIHDLIGRLKASHFGLIPAEAYRSEQHPAPSSASTTSEPSSPSTASGESPKSDPTAPNAPASGRSGDVGLTLRVVDGRATVTHVREGSTAASAGVLPGWILKSVNGEPAQNVIDDTAHGALSETLARGMAGIGLGRMFAGPVGTQVSATFENAESREVTLAIPRGPAPGKPAKFGNLPEMYVEFQSRRLDPDNVGYISLSIFLDPVSVAPAFDRAIRQFSDTSGLIIDLRGNPGGLGAMAMGLGGYFVTTPNQKLGTMKMRESSLNFVLNPRLPAYTKPLAFLVDEASLSTSEIFAGGMQALGRAKVFGSRTGGAALPSVIEKLPSGDTFQYAVADYVSANGARLEGQGVTPDQETPLTRKALLQGRDPALEAALSWIKGGGK